MKLLCVTDLHGDLRSLRRILDHAGTVDVILLGGDLTNFGTPNQAEGLVLLAREHCPVVMAVAGNCDSPFIDERLAELGVSLFGRGMIHAGIGFHGVSAMPPWLGSMYELTEPQIQSSLEHGAAQIEQVSQQVVLSHVPPRQCSLDRTRKGVHVGSSALRNFIARRKPALVVCGHIHEARGVQTLGETMVVNCGTAFEGCYATATLDDKTTVELCDVPG